ncbi:cytochrome c oxidase copper chaperone 2-like [Aristolochia californica]|uniref:cytochrome c oxidase copper chaperone 2-like n=1 Tax=Aristolochia californica TaxID=171875 RepID=UPI0035DF5C8F
MGASESGFSEHKSFSSSSLLETKSQKVNPGTTTATVSDAKPRKKICCACPDTKKLRDECIVEHGEAACRKWIDAHLECLRAEGFNV